MFFIPCDNWKTLFIIKVHHYPELLFDLHVLAFFETSEMKEVHISFFISTLTVKCQKSKLKLTLRHTCVTFYSSTFFFTSKVFLKTLSGRMLFHIVLLKKGFTNSLCKVTTNFTNNFDKVI